MVIKTKRKREVKTEEWLARVIAQLTEALVAYDALEAYLIGSFARGEWDDYSDIDLIVMKQTDKGFLARLKEFSEILKPDFAIDYFIYTPEEFARMPRISDFFRSSMKDAVKIYEKK